MEKLQNSKASRGLVIAAVVAALVGACSTARQQPPATNTQANLAKSPGAALQPIPKEPKGNRVVNRAIPPPPALSDKEGSSNKSSKTILVQIHQANLKEIAIAKMAEEKASSSEVQAYAEQLVEDHANADNMVNAMAQKSGARLHQSAQGKVIAQELASSSGAEFDRLFLRQTKADHERLIRELQQEREDASNDDVEALIDKLLPIFEQHHDLAQILMKKEQA